MAKVLSAGKFPDRITLELTNRCNLNCTFCPRKYMEKERGFMDVDVAKSLLDEMAAHAPVSVVPFFRGESTLHPEWHVILKYAQQLRVGEIQFTTNASLLTPENVEKVLDLDLSFISFSLDTIDPALYNTTRRGADFETTCENVLNFLKRRDELGVRTQVQVSAVETPEHKPGMQAFVEYWQPLVDRVRVYVEHSNDGNPGSIDESLPDFDERKPCHKPYTDMVIYWNGEVAVCNHDWTRMKTGQRIGNVAQDGISNVWTSEPYMAIREAHEQNALEGVSPCQDCDHWKMYYMKSGYLGRTYTKNRTQES